LAASPGEGGFGLALRPRGEDKAEDVIVIGIRGEERGEFPEAGFREGFDQLDEAGIGTVVFLRTGHDVTHGGDEVRILQRGEDLRIEDAGETLPSESSIGC
jgi:hypothetical protein